MKGMGMGDGGRGGAGDWTGDGGRGGWGREVGVDGGGAALV